MSNAEPRACSIARTLDVVGEKWALLAIREVFLGNRRFDEMAHHRRAPRHAHRPAAYPGRRRASWSGGSIPSTRPASSTT